LVNPSVRPFSSFSERLRPRNYAALLRLALLEVDARAREAAVLRLTSANAGAHAGLPELWARYSDEHPVTRINVMRQLIAAARYRAPAAAPRTALLVLASAQDGLVDPKCSVTLAARWKVPLVVHPSAGHDLPLDDPRWVADRVKEWLKPT